MDNICGKDCIILKKEVIIQPDETKRFISYQEVIELCGLASDQCYHDILM